MNKYLTRTLLALCLVSTVAFVGCGTTPAAKFAQGERVLITSVNDGMTEWSAYVNAGKATQKQVDAVKTGYNAYVTAQGVAKAVLEKSVVSTVSPTELTTANKAVTDAEAAVLALLNQYIK